MHQITGERAEEYLADLNGSNVKLSMYHRYLVLWADRKSECLAGCEEVSTGINPSLSKSVAEYILQSIAARF